MTKTITSLPVELVDETCQFLSKQDFINLRESCRFLNGVAITHLSKQIANKLKVVYALTTLEGLQTLLGICQIPEMLQHIQEIHLAGPRLSTFAAERSFANVQRQELDQMILAQQSFELHGSARSLCEELFNLLRSAPSLTTIRVGNLKGEHKLLKIPRRIEQCKRQLIYRPGLAPHDAIMGMPKTTSQLNLGPESRDIYLNRFRRGACSQEFRNTLSILFGAMTTTRFSAKIVRLYLDNVHVPHLQGTETDDAITAWNVWKVLDQSFIHSVSFSHKDHDDQGYITLSPNWIAQCVRAAKKTDYLDLIGNDNYLRPCNICSTTISALMQTPPTGLKRLSLDGIVTDEGSLSRLLQDQLSALENVRFRETLLTTGSWRPVFQMMTGIIRLNQLDLSNLWEKGSNPTTIEEVPGNGDLHCDINVDNAGDVRRFLLLATMRYDTTLHWQMGVYPLLVRVFLPSVPGATV
ncbi:hypothetical protein BDV96DRAFT_602450 [Lophiotrema nucula]|uniref:F-box domain-containing protein n=1 Tax=Lophiotrema nucula TaxID=690887 RepID=A0A6A5YXU7_9PLEO|nr:hypothetical protein BDV96DRAFT_602450 [Lophiotrema nucula]